MDDLEIMALDTLEHTHWWYISRKKRLKIFLEFLPENLEVLDLGSASGGNTIFMSSLGHKVTSFEYSLLGVELQRKKSIPVVHGDARDMPFAESKFDLVVCLDVLEHIYEDNQVLAEIHRVLKPGGKALLSVPQDPSMWSSHDTAVNHVRRYTKIELITKLQLANFDIEQVSNSIIFLKPLIRVYRKFSSGSSLRKVNRVVNQILLCICDIEKRLRVSKFPGLTLWVVASKN